VRAIRKEFGPGILSLTKKNLTNNAKETNALFDLVIYDHKTQS
jgi:hypothetical protein